MKSKLEYAGRIVSHPVVQGLAALVGLACTIVQLFR